MATLTWQDVAGRVAAPDFSDASAMITQGIAGLGKSVADIGTAPEKRRLEEVAKQNQLLALQMGFTDENVNKAIALDKNVDQRKEKEAVKEFSKNQSFLESGVRKAALAGMPLADYLATDKVFQGMSEEARAYSAANLSDAYTRGDETRITMAERAKDDAYRAKRDAVSDAQWARSFALSAENTRLARAERAEAKKAAEALKPKVWKTGNDKTDKAMSLLAQNTGMQFIEASGAAYQDKTLSELGKGYKNLGAVSDVFGKVNAERRAQRLPMLPENVLKRIIDTGVGSNSTFDGLNDVDDAAITDALLAAGKQFDTALKGREFYEYLSTHVDAGTQVEQRDIDIGWNKMFPKAPQPVAVKPALPSKPSLMDTYKTGGR